MKEVDSRQFIPPALFQQVCNFAIRETMCSGVGLHGEFDYTVSDCMQVAMLYPKNEANFRLPSASGLATLYNSWADLQEKVEERRALRPHTAPLDYVSKK